MTYVEVVVVRGEFDAVARGFEPRDALQVRPRIVFVRRVIAARDGQFAGVDSATIALLLKREVRPWRFRIRVNGAVFRRVLGRNHCPDKRGLTAVREGRRSRVAVGQEQLVAVAGTDASGDEHSALNPARDQHGHVDCGDMRAV